MVQAELKKAIDNEVEELDARKNLVMEMPAPGENEPLAQWIDDQGKSAPPRFT